MHPPVALLLLAVACHFEVASRIDYDPAPRDSASPADDTAAGGGAGGSDGGGDTAEPVDTGPIDEDGDGWTPVDGDCDDGDPSVHPGAADTCDGRDDDCDGETDEDAADDYEPNDATPTDLGSLDDDPERTVEAVLSSDLDVDLYEFRFEDSGWSLFTLTVSLGSIPAGATFGLTLENVDNGIVYYFDYGSGSLTAVVGDTAMHDDGGTWRVTVESFGGADCSASYLLTVELDD